MAFSTSKVIELRLLEIPQEAIAIYEAKYASQLTLASRTISEQSAPHLITQATFPPIPRHLR
ncbi:hypothetical protein JOD03_001122 [Chryseomicrobium aureum]|uniref:hypothetical protein n=1 Tax=Chryseomicrobium aureum TaxID=1441723 RepID=UPI00195E91BE|nr:hypothetical protein [Chryseomicrobium aureum]MBM7706220.1 hypothetical protein [Chryseomicrobium aureum]